jgi:hypothetical protein
VCMLASLPLLLRYPLTRDSLAALAATSAR